MSILTKIIKPNVSHAAHPFCQRDRGRINCGVGHMEDPIGEKEVSFHQQGIVDAEVLINND